MNRILVATVAVMTLLGAGAGPASAAKKAPNVLIQTVPQGAENTFFDTDALWHPQIAQTLTVNEPMTWTSLRLRTLQLKIATSREVFRQILDGGYDERWFTSFTSGRSVTAMTTVEVWRYNGAEDLPDVIDLASGFTQIHRSETRRTIPIGKSVAFPLAKGLAITPGRYVFVLSLRFDDPLVFNLRFAGQENGTYTLGGYGHDHPVAPECAAYTKTKDANPGGQAYRPRPAGMPDPETLTVPFTTVFEVALTKVLACGKWGTYDPNTMIWNPGDLQMTVFGRR